MKTNPATLNLNRIKSLMPRHRISEAPLARKISVPQPTVSRILSGTTRNPQISTVVAIARVLGSTVDHLVDKDTSYLIPVLEWNEIAGFAESGIDEWQKREWIPVSKPPAKGSFAVKTTPSMEPRYRNGSTIIVEPTETYRDFQVVIVSFNGEEPAVRRLVKDGSHIFLKKLDGALLANTIPLTSSTKIFGVVTEARITE
jgi:SOS-response transcriptional repressor LexA